MMSAVRCAAALFLVACLGLYSGRLSAADDAVGAWAAFYTSGVLHRGEEEGPWRYGFYADARLTDRLGGVTQYTLLPGLGLRINSRLTFWAGYTYFRSEIDDGPSYNENRLFQQVSWNMVHWQYSTLSSRTRLEQRARGELHGTDLRLRQQFRLDRRFKSNPDLKFILGDEIFYQLRDTRWTRKGYAQNRFYTGFGWDFHAFVVEALYMHQHYPIRKLPDRANHLLVLNFKM